MCVPHMHNMHTYTAHSYTYNNTQNTDIYTYTAHTDTQVHTLHTNIHRERNNILFSIFFQEPELNNTEWL